MNILRWTKPKKVHTVEQWATNYGFEDGPTGGYRPNMSEADQLSWKAKITGKKLGFPQVEIRKTTSYGSQIVLIVNLGSGYNYKYYRAECDELRQYETCDDYVDERAKWYADHYPEVYQSVEDARQSLYGEFTDEEFMKMKHPTRGINVHISTNGPIQMTFEEMNDMQKAIEEAETALSSLEHSN